MSNYLQLAKVDLKYANFGLTHGTDEIEIMRWVSEPRYNVNFRQSKDDVILIYNATLDWLQSLLPPSSS